MSKHTVKYKDVTVASGTKLWDALEAKDAKLSEKLYKEMMQEFRKYNPKKVYTIADRESLQQEHQILLSRWANGTSVRHERDRLVVVRNALDEINSLELKVVKDFTPTHVSMVLLPNGEVEYGTGGYTKELK
jgi:hypothetical protein